MQCQKEGCDCDEYFVLSLEAMQSIACNYCGHYPSEHGTYIFNFTVWIYI
jgi:hypothetical protein